MVCCVTLTFQCSARVLWMQSHKEPEQTRTLASDTVPRVGSKRQGGLIEKDYSDEPSFKRGTGGMDTVSTPAPAAALASTAHDGAPSLESASHVQAAGGKHVHAAIEAVPAPPPAVVAVVAKEGVPKPVAVSFLSLCTRRPDPIARNTASAMAQPVAHLTDLFVGHCGIRICVRCAYCASVVLVFCQ
jgi:hypothetical protein